MAKGYKKLKNENAAPNISVYHGQQLKETEIVLTPEQVTFFQLSHYIPDPEPKDKPDDIVTWLRYGGVLFVAFFSSLFFKPFCASFTTEAFQTLGVKKNHATNIGKASGWASLFVNFSIGIVSLLAAWWVLSQLPKKLKEADMKNYSDQVMVASLVGVIVASIIGVFPNFVFVNDALKKDGKSLSYIIFMQAVQFVAGVAMNIRGGMSVLNIEKEAKLAAAEVKYLILCDLNGLLEQPFSDEELRILSRGENHVRRFPTLRRRIGYASYALPALYIMGVFAASATIFAPFLVGTGLVVGGIATLNILIAVISTGLLLLLMGFTNGSLIDRLFMGGDKKILNVRGKDEAPDSPIGVVIIALVIGLGLGLLSMGGPAAVVFNYMVPNVIVAFAGGILAGFGMNCFDLFDLANKVLNTIWQFIKKVYRYWVHGEPMKPKEVHWETREEFIHSRMKIISDMDHFETLQRYGDRVRTEDQEYDPLEEELNEQPADGPRVLYSGALKYNANNRFEKLSGVIDSDSMSKAGDEDFEGIRSQKLYNNRHVISKAWKQAGRDDLDASQGLVIDMAVGAA